MKKIWKWLKKLFNNTQAFVEKYAKPSIQTVENIKAVIDSPVTDLLTAIIPGQLDDMSKNMLRQALPMVIQDLKILADCNGLTSEEIVQKGIAELAKYTKGDKQEAYTRIAAKLASYMSDDHKWDWGELSSLIVYTYKEFFVKAA